MENKTEDKDTQEVVAADTSKTEDKKADAKTFTQEELNEVLSKRLKEEKDKLKAENKQAIADALAEEKRLAKLSAEEKEKELNAKQAQELAEKEKNITLRENKLTGIEKLDELKIPIKFVDFVLEEDLESMNKKIDTFSKEWNKAISEAVAQQLKGNAPKDVNTKTDSEAPNFDDGATL